MTPRREARRARWGIPSGSVAGTAQVTASDPGLPLLLECTEPFIARVAAMNEFRREIGIREVEEPWFSEDGTRMWVADGGMFYFITGTTVGFLLYRQERNDPYEIGVFHRFAEAEKYLLRVLWDGARGRHFGGYQKAMWWQWFQEGPDPRVLITEDGYKRRLVLPDEPESRCVINDDSAALEFTHAMALSVDELEAVMREGINDRKI